jgi:hypothetical protein
MDLKFLLKINRNEISIKLPNKVLKHFVFIIVNLEIMRSKNNIKIKYHLHYS